MSALEQEEIKSLKQQRLIAVLALIGAVVSFFVTNLETIEGIFEVDPKVTIISSEKLLADQAKILATNLDNGEKYNLPIGAKNDAEEKYVSLKPGAYGLQADLNGDIVFDKVIFVKKNMELVVNIPPVFIGNIGVTVELLSTSVLPNSSLDLTISSSGIGYAWLFSKENDTYTLLYPMDDGLPISPEKSIQFPLASDIRINAENIEGEYSLLVVVTSTDDVEFAKKISLLFNPAVSAKANITQGGPIWGAKELAYNVKQ